LNFSRPTELTLSLVNLDKLFAHVLELSSSTLTERGIAIEMDLSKLAPRSNGRADSLQLRGDPDLISQVLYGLILNASQAVAHGGAIAVRACKKDGGIDLELVDDGPGVAREDVGKIFEPFFTTKASGTGLGLPMARRIVELHGGQIQYVEDAGIGEQGRGACFRMHLPLEDAA
jgi:two-component system sensor histidine kinase HydH